MRKELTDLRRAKAQAGIDVYVVPTDDFHGSEYVGDYFKCRHYVSGFTGSAGTLVVTADWAGLWTDGRYFLQAAQQLEGSGIDLCKMREPGVPTVEEWLEQNMTAGRTLGFDGRTMTAGEGLAIEKALEKQQVRIVFDRDLVGEIWQDRPALSEAPVWELPESYAGRSRRDKLEALRKDVRAAGADSFILTSLDALCWLLNIRGDDVDCCPVVLGYLLLDADGIRLYAERSKFPEALLGELADDGVTIRPYLQIFEDVKQLPAGSAVLTDPDKLSYAILRNIPESVQRLEAKNPTERPKAVKTGAECSHVRTAHIRDGAALSSCRLWVEARVGREPITELSAAQKLEQFRSQQENYLGPSFSPIMGYGPHGAIIHYGAPPESDAALEPHGFLLADTGGHYLDGSTDVTRTFALGPLTEEMKHCYTLVLRGNLHLAAAVFRAGCTGPSLDYLARKPLWDEGMDFNHGTGHGVGYLLSVHEGPQNIRYQSETAGRTCAALEPGMITSDEPGLYLEGKYGIRLENLLLCVEREQTEFGTFLGFETLTMCPFDLDAVVPEELSQEEKTLLNAYHRTVRETLSPYFTDSENEWLRQATREI